MLDTPPHLSIIIVNWNVRELLQRALASIYASWGGQAGLDVIVVDNGSQDGSRAMLRELYPHVRLVANPGNLGFGRANNQGLALAQGDYVLILNPDTHIAGQALHEMVNYAAAHPDVGMIGPQLLWPDGSTQSSRRRFPTLPLLFLESTWLQSLAPRRWLQHYYVADQPDDVTQDVDWITGAAMLTRHTVIEQIGGFDEDFFMYSEELDWCRRIKAAGWRVVYHPKAQIVHHEGKSSEQVIAARHIYFQSSKVHYARKYHGALAAESLRLWLMTQYGGQMMLEGAKWLVGHRRTLRVARLRAYRQVLHSRLRQHTSID